MLDAPPSPGRAHYVFDEVRRDPIEGLSIEGAEMLKARVEAYWRGRGCGDIEVEIIRSGFCVSAGFAMHIIRSNLVDGLPLSARVKLRSKGLADAC